MLWRFIQELEAKLAHPARPSLHEVQQAGLHLDAGAVPMQMKRASVQLQQKLANRPDAAELAESGILDDPDTPVKRCVPCVPAGTSEYPAYPACLQYR